MNQFNYPTRIFHGSGALAALAEHLAENRLKRLMLVTDPGLVEIGLADRAVEVLSAKGAEIDVYAQVHPNPIEQDVVEGGRQYRAGRFDGIIALGGGSAMDAAKVIALLATHDEPVAQYDDAKGGDAKIVHPIPPVFAIPTTAGTGSEVGRAAVIILEETKTKTIIFHPSLMPTIAVLDPELTLGLPPNITAATGMDAFTHCLEAYLSTGYHPMADAIALGGIELVVSWLPKAVQDGQNVEARSHMLMAASMGATAFQKGLGMIHSLAHPLSVHYGTHHGLANALLLGPALSYAIEARAADFSDDLKKRFLAVGERMPGGAGKAYSALPALIDSFCASVEISGGLGPQGLREEDIPALSEEALADPCHQTNPIPCTLNDFVAVYSRAR